jgi:hypothetical protein
MERLFVVTKWLHKYVGLVIVLFLAWMSVSGVLMNHPNLISRFSVPRWLVPPQYHIQNWNRNPLTDLVFLSRDSNVAFAAGKQGVWKSVDGGKRFVRFSDGLPSSAYYRKTRDLFLYERGTGYLFAAMDGGLYVCDLRGELWRAVELGSGDEPVKKIIAVGDRLVVATASGLYASSPTPSDISFSPVSIRREEPERRVSLIELFFSLHSGSAWLLAGRLLFDVVGAILFFLCVSAFYTWYFPWQRRRSKKSRLLTNPHSAKAFKLMFKYHLKLGIWIAAVLLIIGGTGFFMRPPLLAVIVHGSVPASAYPGLLSANPWHDRIQNMLYDAVDGKIIVQASDGLWVADADLAQPFRPLDLDVPIFVMGATVFEPRGTGGHLIGSFAGLFHWSRSTGRSIDLLTQEEVTGVASLQPAEHMITGYFQTPHGEQFVSTFEQGVVPVGGVEANGRFEVPDELTGEYRMPLWNYLFEIHNGRFFKDIIGGLYILIIPLGSLLFVLISLSGIYDWVYLKVVRRSPNRAG